MPFPAQVGALKQYKLFKLYVHFRVKVLKYHISEFS